MHMSVVSRVLPAFAVGVALALPACSTGPGEGSYTIMFGGDTTFTVSGEAVFGTSIEEGVERWTIYLGRGALLSSDFDAVAIGRHGSGTPIGIGTHSISDAMDAATDAEDIDAAYTLGRSAGSFRIFPSVSGTLSISAASSDRVTGEFDFRVSHFFTWGSDDGPFAGVQDLTLSGSFSAVPGTIPGTATQ